MRSQLLRAAARSKAAHRAPAARSFATTARRQAEVELTIDGKKVSIEAGSALIQACEKAGVTIPRYCYHEYGDAGQVQDTSRLTARQETTDRR